MTLSRLLPVTLTVSLLLASCGQQSATEQVAKTPVSIADQAQTNAALHTFAKQLAKAMVEPGVRTLIAQQTALRVTGDTEALYATLASQSTGKGTFAQALSSGLSTQSLNALVAQIPKLHIAVRGAAWNAATTVPLVAVAAEGGDEYAPITAYDAQGRMHILDGRMTPTMPVVAVGVNERVDDQGNVLPQILPGTQNGATLTAQVCHGVKLVRVDIQDAKEPFIRGSAEIFVAVKGAGIGWHGQLPSVFDAAHHIVEQYFGCTDGDVHFYWYERDGGAQNHVIYVGPYSFGWMNDNEDDFMGSVKMDKSLFDGSTTDIRDMGTTKQYTQ